MYFTLPIAFSNQTANQTWGANASVSATCPPDLCWQPQRSRTRLWGMIIIEVNTRAVDSALSTPGYSAVRDGYNTAVYGQLADTPPNQLSVIFAVPPDAPIPGPGSNLPVNISQTHYNAKASRTGPWWFWGSRGCRREGGGRQQLRCERVAYAGGVRRLAHGRHMDAVVPDAAARGGGGGVGGRGRHALPAAAELVSEPARRSKGEQASSANRRTACAACCTLLPPPPPPCLPQAREQGADREPAAAQGHQAAALRVGLDPGGHVEL